MRLKPGLLKRVFDIDIEQCSQCGGALTIIAAIENPDVIAKILAYLGLVRPGTAPITGTRSPAFPAVIVPLVSRNHYA